MTELLTGLETPSDAELISRVRGGDVSAYGELFSRHVEAARRLGRQLVRGPDVDDLVSEAFAKTLTALQSGGGPDVAFRAYLLTSVRRLHVDRLRATKRVQPADDMSVYDDGVPFQDTAVANFESGAAARAFSSLPERWQLVLWHLEVERQKPADIAPLLGMSPNSVSALAYRAREGLRQAFLTMHLADCPTEQCRWVNEHLGGYVRQGLSRRDTAKVEAHLDDCRRCTAMYLELTEVNSDLAGIIAPLLLGAAAAGYLSSTGAGVTGLGTLLGRVRDGLGGPGGGGAGGGAATGTGGVTAGGVATAGGIVAAGVAAVTAAVLVFSGPAEKEVITEADQPVTVQTPEGPVAGDGADDAAKDSTTTDDAAGATELADLADLGGAADPAGELPTPYLAAGDVPTDSPTGEVAPEEPSADSEPAALTGEPSGGDETDDATAPGGTSGPAAPPATDRTDGDTSDPGTDPGDGGDTGSDPGAGPGPGPGAGPGGDTVAFAFAGTPTTTSVDGADPQEYTVSVTFEGVSGGDVVSIRLTAPQAKICDGPCTGKGLSSLEVTVPAGRDTLTVSFDAWLPGKSTADLEASRNGGAPLVHTLT